jgi:hypothetical protein
LFLEEKFEHFRVCHHFSMFKQIYFWLKIIQVYVHLSTGCRSTDFGKISLFKVHILMVQQCWSDGGERWRRTSLTRKVKLRGLQSTNRINFHPASNELFSLVHQWRWHWMVTHLCNCPPTQWYISSCKDLQVDVHRGECQQCFQRMKKLFILRTHAYVLRLLKCFMVFIGLLLVEKMDQWRAILKENPGKCTDN